MTRSLARTWMAAALAACLLTSGAARTADVKPQDAAAARELFDQGRKLVSENRFAEACPKFEESQKLDPGAGTLFHLADCYEHADKPASAWALFLEVASQSAAAQRADREAAARERAAALRPKLPQLTIVVDPANRFEGFSVKRDGTAAGKGTWATPVPIDPGRHVIEASAPGRTTWSSTIEIPNGPGTIQVKIPMLQAPLAAAPSTAQPAAEMRADGKGRRTLGLVVGGVGVLAFGASVGLAAHAKSKFNDSASMCQGIACNQEGADLRDSARSEGNIATIVGGTGLVAIAAGTVLYLTAPNSSSSSASAVASTPALSVGPSGFLMRGVW